jgi:methylglutaconyl-CoA hydratase
MDEPLVLIDRKHPHCSVLILNRPNKRNALSIDLMKSLCEGIEESQSLPDQRVIILKGAGAVFSAGLDLEEAGNIALEESSALMVAKTLKTIYECPLVTIATVHGAALAGGAGLVCACDLAIAESSAIFGFPETRRGLVAAQIMPFVQRLVPFRLLNELIFLGDPIDAKRAYEIGLINKVSITYNGLCDALKYAESIIRGAPKATTKAKKLIQQLDTIDLYSGLKKGFELHHEVRQDNESIEGMRAFLEKRLPNWG